MNLATNGCFECSLLRQRKIQKYGTSVKHRPIVETFHDIDSTIRSRTTKRRAIQMMERLSYFLGQSVGIMYY